MMRRRIEFSIIIPTKMITPALTHETLRSLASQTYKSFEAIVLTDACTDACRRVHKKFSWLTIIHLDNTMNPAQKRNKGAELSRGVILAFLDSDAFVPNFWLMRGQKAFKKWQSAAVCGPGILPTYVGFEERLFDEVSRSFLGSGSLRYRFTKQKTRFVDDYPSMNFFVRRDVFQATGGFYQDYWPGEDSKFCNDLVHRDKEQIVYDPNVFVYHHRRNNLKDYFRQHRAYGYHRGYFFAQGDKNSRKLLYLFPALFLSYLLLLPFMNNAFYLFPLFFYAFFLGATSFFAWLRHKNLIVAFGTGLIILLTHILYGASFIKGVGTFWTQKIL